MEKQTLYDLIGVSVEDVKRAMDTLANLNETIEKYKTSRPSLPPCRDKILIIAPNELTKRRIQTDLADEKHMQATGKRSLQTGNPDFYVITPGENIHGFRFRAIHISDSTYRIISEDQRNYRWLMQVAMPRLIKGGKLVCLG